MIIYKFPATLNVEFHRNQHGLSDTRNNSGSLTYPHFSFPYSSIRQGSEFQVCRPLMAACFEGYFAEVVEKETMFS